MTIKIIAVPSIDIEVSHATDFRIDVNYVNEMSPAEQLNKFNFDNQREGELVLKGSKFDVVVSNMTTTAAESQSTLVADGSVVQSSQENVASLSDTTQVTQTQAEKVPLKRSAAEKISKTNVHLIEQSTIQAQKDQEENQKELSKVSKEKEKLAADLGLSESEVKIIEEESAVAGFKISSYRILTGLAQVRNAVQKYVENMKAKGEIQSFSFTRGSTTGVQTNGVFRYQYTVSYGIVRTE